MKPEAQLRPRQDAQQGKDAMEATFFPAKGDVAGSAALRNGFIDVALTLARPTSRR